MTSLSQRIAREFGTPAVAVDLDRVERNIRKLQAACDAAGLANRPHIKTHKSPVIAAMQRDLLPLIEGTTVTTKHGTVKTDHILFIASGAFHVSKPSDLLPELQGRLPIRVELNPLTIEDFRRILTDTEASLVKQAVAMRATEGVNLAFTDDAVDELARVAVEVNSSLENIGARRLQTVIERVLDEISFTATDRSGDTVTVDAAYVRQQVGDLAANADLSRFIL